jgi:type 1 fimbria pilin
MMKPIFIPLAVALAASSIAHAATNGTEGPDSTATVDMSLTVSDPAPFIQISGLQDFDFVVAPGEGIQDQYFACVYVSEPSVNYSLSIGGTDLTDGSNNYIYQISGGSLAGSFAALDYVHGTDPNPITRSGVPPSNTPGCATNEFLTVRLTIAAAHTSTRTNGQATATVTLTVRPD